MKGIRLHEVTHVASIFSSHMVYEIKLEYEDLLGLKVGVAKHEIKDSDSEKLHSDCGMCSPTGIWDVISVSGLLRWCV